MKVIATSLDQANSVLGFTPKTLAVSLGGKNFCSIMAINIAKNSQTSKYNLHSCAKYTGILRSFFLCRDV